MIKLGTLGTLDLRTGEGEELRAVLVQPKRMALLSFLAIASPRTFHRRDSLLGIFWPEMDQAHARAALRQALHFLRQYVGADVVVSRGAEEVGLDFAKIQSDVAAFEDAVQRDDLETAVSLYTGGLLLGLAVADAPEFDRWVDLERARVERAYTKALETLADQASQRGEHDGAVAWWRKVVEQNPYSPSATLALMSALEAAGDRAGALSQGEASRAALEADLGVESDPAVESFLARLRQPGVVPAGAAAGDDVGLEPKSPNPARARRVRLAATLAGAFLIGYGLFAGSRSAAEAAPAPERTALAVLPFEATGADTEPYVAAGLAEGIVSRLGGLGRLSVLGANESGVIGTTPVIVGPPGSDLGVDFTLRASVQRLVAADGTAQLRITPVVERVADGVIVWTDTLVGEASELFEIESRIAETVAGLLGVPLLRTERDWMRDHPTDCLEAYDLYLRGNQFLAAAGSPDFALAIDLFEQAVEADPDFAHAHAKLSIAHTSMYWFGNDRTEERLRQAETAADRAMTLRSDLPLSHLAEGWYHYWGKRDFDRALRHFELARATWPGITDALVLIGGIRRRQGDWDHSLALLAEAAGSNPACWICDVESANTHILRRDFDAARRAMSRARALAPTVEYPRRVAAFLELADNGDVSAARDLLTPASDFVDVLFAVPSRWTRLARVIAGDLDSLLLALDVAELRDPAGYHLSRAELAWRNGNPGGATAHYESASVLLEELCALRPNDPDVYGALAVAYAGLGLRDEAIHEAMTALQLRPVAMDAVDGPLGLEILARVYTMLGDYDAAIDTLEGLLAMPSTISATMLRLDPVWAPLRDRAAFQNLVR